MKNRFPKGLLITVEGVRGVGKTYFLNRLEKNLRVKHRVPIVRSGGFLHQPTKELPPITRFLRELMESAPFLDLPWLCETTMLVSEQAFNIDQYVLPAVVDRKVVLYENYNDALIVYQVERGNNTGVPKQKRLQVLKALVNLQYEPFEYPRPNLIIYLSAPLKTIFQRIKDRDPRPASKKDKYLISRAMENYEDIYRNNRRILRIQNHEDTDLTDECEKVAAKVAKCYGAD